MLHQIILESEKKVIVRTEHRELEMELPSPIDAKAWFEGLKVLYEVRIT